jgi:hypothetical protein
MKARVLKVCFLALAIVLGRYAFAGVDDLAKEVQTTSAAIEANLNKFKQDGNTESLGEAQRLIVQLGQPWHEDPKLVRTQVLRFKLKLLQVCFESQDKTYDMKNPPEMYVNVRPPIFTPGMMSGMEPAAIQDPVARKAYEAAIAENKRREQQYAREKSLQEFVDIGMRGIRGHLNLSKQLGTLKPDITLIRDTVKNADLMKKIDEEILVNFCDKNGVPLGE